MAGQMRPRTPPSAAAQLPSPPATPSPELQTTTASVSYPPVVVLLGPTASGKGTLGKQLAQSFNLAHISMGDFTRELCAPPLPGVSSRINQLVHTKKPIPSSILEAEFGSDPENVPILLRLYMYQLAGEVAPAHLRLPLLKKRIQDLWTQPLADGLTRARAILLDEFPRTLEAAEQAEIFFGTMFPLVVINLQCSTAILRERYLSRARPGDTEVERFGKRMKRFEAVQPTIVDFYRQRDVLIEVSTEGSKEQAWSDLIEGLWRNTGWSALFK